VTNTAIAARLEVDLHRVGRWRQLFAGLPRDGLSDEPRRERRARPATRRLPRRSGGSLRSMAAVSGYPPSTIHRIWRAFCLQPHRTETFKLFTDPLFVEKVRDIVGLYLVPPDRMVVLCVHEKTQVQALDGTQPLLPMRPGQADRHTHDYTRCGTTSLFAALDVKLGTIVGRFLLRLGLSPQAKAFDLKGRVRCRGCRARGQAVVSIKWGALERVRRWRLWPREPLKLENVDRVNEGHVYAERLPN